MTAIKSHGGGCPPAAVRLLPPERDEDVLSVDFPDFEPDDLDCVLLDLERDAPLRGDLLLFNFAMSPPNVNYP
jgi:hypothetical protein